MGSRLPILDDVALAHAILVSLSEQSGSGYELAHRFDRSIGYFWGATHQQIYRTLRTMETDGWVQATAVTQQGRPDKKVYAVAQAGHAELSRWIAAPLSARGSSVLDHRLRELAVKIRGTDADNRATVRAQAAALRAERGDRLDVYRALEKKQFCDPHALTGAALHQYLVLRGGIRAEESAIDWLDEIDQALR